MKKKGGKKKNKKQKKTEKDPNSIMKTKKINTFITDIQKPFLKMMMMKMTLNKILQKKSE